MRSRSLQRISLFAWLIVASCMADSPSSIQANLPGVGNQRNAFAFSVVARSFDMDESYALSFDGDSATVGLAATGYASGSGTLELRDAAGQIVFSWHIASNLVEGTSAPVKARPATARIHLTGFTGTLAIGVHGR